jgi:hypothetical protein
MNTKLMTEAEYDSAMKRIDEIFQAQEGPEAEELDKLVDLVVAYEDEHFPLGLPNLDDFSEGEQRASVMRGLDQARRRQFVEGPNLD